MEITVIPRHRSRSLTPLKKLIHNRCSLWGNCSLRTLFFLCIFSLIFSLVLFFSFFFLGVRREKICRNDSIFTDAANFTATFPWCTLFVILINGFDKDEQPSRSVDFGLYQVVVICETLASCYKIYLFVMTVIVWSGSSMQNVLIIPIINIAICSSSNVIVNVWASNTVILNLFLC